MLLTTFLNRIRRRLTEGASVPVRPVQRLRVMRLEDRRLLDAGFGLGAMGILTLDGFDAADSLTISGGVDDSSGSPSTSAVFTLSNGIWDAAGDLHGGDFQVSADGHTLSLNSSVAITSLQIDGTAIGGGRLDFVESGSGGFQVPNLNVTDVDFVRLNETGTDIDTLSVDIGRLLLIDSDDVEIEQLITERRAQITSLAGDIWDAPGTTISVGYRGLFEAANITLGDDVGDSTNFNTLKFTATGDVQISEDSSMRVVESSSGATVSLFSANQMTVEDHVILNAGDLNLEAVSGIQFQADSVLRIDVDGEIPRVEYDVVTISGEVTLDGDLDIHSSRFFDDGTAFTILHNDGTDAVQGTFSGLLEGDVITGDNGQNFVISYVGGDGNDVVLYAGTPVYEFSTDEYDIAEGSGGGTTDLTGTVIRSGNTAIASSVNVAIAADSADSADFTAETVTVNFAAGQTSASFVVTVAADTVVETDETIGLSMSGFTSQGTAGATATATVTITNDDTARLSISDLTIDEDAGLATFQVTSSNASEGDLSFTVAASASGASTASGSDVSLGDYSGTIAGDGSSTSTTVSVAISDDLRVEGVETFLMTMFAARFSGASDVSRVLIDDGVAVGTIVDNDFATVTFVSDASSIREDETTVSVEVRLSIQATGNTGDVGLDRTIGVDVNHTGGTTTDTGTDADFTYADATLTFQPGDGTNFSQSVSLSIHEDILDDPGETIELSLQNLADGTVVNGTGQVQVQPFGQYTLTIDDDDGTGPGAGTSIYDLPPAAGDVRVCNHGGNLEIWVDNVLQSSRPSSEVQTLVINGGADHENVWLDFTAGPFTTNVIVNGRGGDDTLRIVGPVASSLISFDGGAGEDSIYLEGVAGGSDYEVTYAGATDPEAGTVIIDQTTVFNYSDIENNSLNITGIADLVLNFAEGDPNIVFTRLNATQTQVSGDTFTTTNFTSPVSSLTVNFTDANDYDVQFVGFADNFNPLNGVQINGDAGGGDIDLTVADLGAFSGDLDIDLGGGVDSITFQNQDQTFSSLSVVADSILATSALDVTGVTTMDAGSGGQINLQNSGNEFDGALILTAQDVLLKTATSANVTLTANSFDADSGGDLTIVSTAAVSLTDLDGDLNALNAQHVSIQVDGTLNQSASGAITTAELAIQQTSGNVLLSAGDNDVDILAVTNVSEFGSVVFFDIDEVEIGSVGAVSGIDTNAGDIQVTSVGDLSVQQTINAAHASSTASIDESITLVSRNGNFVLADNTVITSDENTTAGMSDDITGDLLNIIAGSVSGAGTVNLGTNVELRTDGGVTRQLAPRPTAFAAAPTAGADDAFVTLSDAENMRSNLTSQGDSFLGLLDLVFGVAGEENLQVVIDWGTFRQTAVSLTNPAGDATPSTTIPGAFEFALSDADKTFFTIDNGGERYLIPHEYQLIDLIQSATDRNGRQLSSNIFGVRFSVAQHASISVYGDSVTNPTTSAVETPEDFTAAGAVAPVLDARGSAISLPGSGLALLSSTDPNPLGEFRQQAAPLPFDNNVPTTTGRPFGLAEWEFLAGPSPGFVIVEPTELPPLEIPRIEAPIEALVATRIGGDLSFGDGAASESAIGTDVYLQIRRTFELDADAEVVMPRITDGEFISSRESFEEFVAENPELQDGAGYEVWLVTETGGQVVERPIVKFEITGGRPGPATEELPATFEPYELQELEFEQPPDQGTEQRAEPQSDRPAEDVETDPTDSTQKDATSSSLPPSDDDAAVAAAGAILLPSYAFTRAARWKRWQQSTLVHSPVK